MDKDTQNRLIQIDALLAKLEIESKQILNSQNELAIFDLADSFSRAFGNDKISIIKKVENHKQSILSQKAQSLKIGDTFSVGLRNYVVQEKLANGVLDEEKLEQLIPDESNREDFFKRVLKPQKDVEALLRTLGINTDVKQLYYRENKGELNIKPLN